MTHWTLARVCVPTYMRNTYPGVGSVLRAIIACRPEDSLRPVLSYPSSSLAIVPRQTHDHNPSFPFRLPDSLSLILARANSSAILIAFLSLSEGNLLVGGDSFLLRLFFPYSPRTLAFPGSSIIRLFTDRSYE